MHPACLLPVILLVGTVSQATPREAQRVTSVVDAYPSPSPDGRRIVFHSNRDGSNQVYAVDADGSHLARFTDYPGGSLTPKWSPDGATIEEIGPKVAGAKGRRVYEEGDIEGGIWTVGMVQGLINDIPTCAELVQRIVDEAQAIIQKRLMALTS